MQLDLTTYKQLDFMGVDNPKPELGQMPLWNRLGKLFKSRNDIKFSQVNKIFTTLDRDEVDCYKQYWETVRPKNDTEIFQPLTIIYIRSRRQILLTPTFTNLS